MAKQECDVPYSPSAERPDSPTVAAVCALPSPDTAAAAAPPVAPNQRQSDQDYAGDDDSVRQSPPLPRHGNVATTTDPSVEISQTPHTNCSTYAPRVTLPPQTSPSALVRPSSSTPSGLHPLCAKKRPRECKGCPGTFWKGCHETKTLLWLEWATVPTVSRSRLDGFLLQISLMVTKEFGSPGLFSRTGWGSRNGREPSRLPGLDCGRLRLPVGGFPVGGH